MFYPAVIQIRNGSTRLPGKAMFEVLGKPIIFYLLERLKAIPKIDRIIVSTTVDKSDNELAAYCLKNKIECFRGNNADVLSRICQTTKSFNSGYFIKFWGDSPLIDSEIVSQIISKFESEFQNFDYVSNNHPSTYPEGMQIEIIKIKTLQEINELDLSATDREHVTGHIWGNPDKFKVGNVESNPNIHDSYRIVVDYPEDFVQIKTIIEALYSQKKLFSQEDILKFLDENPDVKNINLIHYESEEKYNQRVFGSKA